MNLYEIKQLPPEVCDWACREYDTLTPLEAATGVDSETKDYNQRDTTVRFAPEWHWFGGVMYQFGLEANMKNNWGFLVNSQEVVQYAEYRENQHFGWHVDTFILSGRPLDRKITVVCLMNDPSEYVGGQLQFKHDGFFAPELKKGMMIAFPSFILHRVIPVMEGVRRSATMWLSGPAFK